ncbi:MAG: exo-alpha-sialidase [Mucilaginibacter sp.]|nr:exo-alpha-sialidase [Mucilaginibacter sp.]
MKRSFVFIPAILMVLFLLNSFFVLKGNEAKKKPIKEGKPFPGLKFAGEWVIEPYTTDLTFNLNKNKSGLLNIVFRSTDGGQTWQNISEGLPENLQREGVRSDGFFANDRGLYLRAGNGVYHSESNSATPFWTKDIFPGRQGNIAPGNNGIFAYNFRGQFLQKINGTSNWSPVYKNFQEQAVRLNGTIDWMYTNYKEKQVCSVFETTGGTVFIGSNNALFRSTNSGKTWKYVHVAGWVMKMVESNGVLLAASTQGILRSTDDGENWNRVINEGGAGITVERIDGGFAAIAYNTITQTNSIHISLDSGKTWNAIGEGLQPSWNSSLIKQIFGLQSSLNILSIKQMGKYLICGRSDGIFRSSDMGKTWKQLSLPATENYGFNLSVSGNVIYVIPNKGC